MNLKMVRVRILVSVCVSLCVGGGVSAVEPPPVPTGFIASEGSYSNRVTLSWKAVSPNHGVSYRIYRWDGDPFVGPHLIVSTPVGGTAANDTSIALGQTYVYWVQAVNAAGVSGYSEPVRGYTLAQPAKLRRIYFNSLDTDPQWAREGQWAFGKPTGQGGTAFGDPDPSSGATRANVFGVNLNGDYSLARTFQPASLTAGPFDCTGYTSVQLRYRRWLNSDYVPYAANTVAVSPNGRDWTTIWRSGTDVEFVDRVWHQVTLPLTPVADGQRTVFVRWSYNIGDQANAYSGWNLDDIELRGVKSRPPKKGK